VLWSWRTPAAIVTVGAVLFVIAAVIGQHPHGAFKNDLGGVGWFGFLVCVLALIVWCVAAFARSRIRPRQVPG
jgi:hypothetical protein